MAWFYRWENIHVQTTELKYYLFIIHNITVTMIYAWSQIGILTPQYFWECIDYIWQHCNIHGLGRKIITKETMSMSYILYQSMSIRYILYQWLWM